MPTWAWIVIGCFIACCIFCFGFFTCAVFANRRIMELRQALWKARKGEEGKP
jgi:uncharacterized membrane protein